MKKNLHDYRKTYEKGALTEDTVTENPMHQFTLWFKEAEESSTIDEVNAMTLSTVDASGMPRGRVVLLKEIGQEGFIFYTNYDSEKGQAIAINNKVCVSFFWPGLERQIIIKGEAIKISEEKSTAYFSKRPRESQLGALVSDQSTSIKDRATLEKRLAVLDKTYEDKSIPKPETWGGYLIRPMEFEFWQGRPSRLHDRIRYAKNNDIWTIERLQP
jgi:pyridoxamine 5'-phosphate oxidase